MRLKLKFLLTRPWRAKSSCCESRSGEIPSPNRNFILITPGRKFNNTGLHLSVNIYTILIVVLFDVNKTFTYFAYINLHISVTLNSEVVAIGSFFYISISEGSILDSYYPFIEFIIKTKPFFTVSQVYLMTMTFP